MKQCPQCGAEYDNHVELCFVDGTELSQLSTSAVNPAVPPPAIRPRNTRLTTLILLGVLFVVATPLVVVGLVYGIGLGPSDPAPGASLEPIVEALPADPDDADGLADPELLDEEPRPSWVVRVDSDPPGAEVREHGNLVCAATPCDIEQYDIAPPIRTLELSMTGYETASVQLEKSERRLVVPLDARAVRRAAPEAPPPSRPSPPPPPPEPAAAEVEPPEEEADPASALIDER